MRFDFYKMYICRCLYDSVWGLGRAFGEDGVGMAIGGSLGDGLG